MRIGPVLSALMLLAAPVVAGAEVVDRSSNGFTVRTVVSVAVPPDRVYEALGRVGEWWSADHTYSGDAKNLRIEAKAGGCFCETLSNGGSVEHGRVVYAHPGAMLRISGALGPLQESGVAGSLTWAFEQTGAGTTATVTYVVGGYVAGGTDRLATIVDQVIATQLQRLKAYIERN